MYTRSYRIRMSHLKRVLEQSPCKLSYETLPPCRWVHLLRAVTSLLSLLPPPFKQAGLPTLSGLRLWLSQAAMQTLLPQVKTGVLK